MSMLLLLIAVAQALPMVGEPVGLQQLARVTTSPDTASPSANSNGNILFHRYAIDLLGTLGEFGDYIAAKMANAAAIDGHARTGSSLVQLEGEHKVVPTSIQNAAIAEIQPLEEEHGVSHPAGGNGNAETRNVESAAPHEDLKDKIVPQTTAGHSSDEIASGTVAPPVVRKGHTQVPARKPRHPTGRNAAAQSSLWTEEDHGFVLVDRQPAPHDELNGFELVDPDMTLHN